MSMKEILTFEEASHIMLPIVPVHELVILRLKDLGELNEEQVKALYENKCVYVKMCGYICMSKDLPKIENNKGNHKKFFRMPWNK